ncbi:cell division protein ZapA [Ostreiculturibacter nitratireducens]|uniref:cell division protein ZapA n=1 Tax=Ostreiculturibacter nitratireducens TaxID=3075226 RepID=UPI0031B5C15E
MPEVKISIGGREFDVACQDGEEHFLHAAAKMLDNEASGLVSNIGRMPESRMLLMAGLMLADKTAALEDQLRAAKARAEAVEAKLASAQPDTDSGEETARALSLLAEMAERVEALAARVETVDED